METVSKSVTINILDVNEEPVIVNLNSVLEIDENLLNVVQVNATDKEDDLICYFVNGQDKAFFEISSSGLLSFKQAPDYEEPKDNGGDNKYDISISVSDDCTSSTSSNIQLTKSSIQTDSVQATQVEVRKLMKI